MDNLNHMKRIDGEANQRPFSESRRTVRGDRAVRRSAPERQMKNLTGTPDTASKDGRKASWVATREYALVPVRDGSFFFSAYGKLGGTARYGEARPNRTASPFCFLCRGVKQR